MKLFAYVTLLLGFVAAAPTKATQDIPPGWIFIGSEEMRKIPTQCVNWSKDEWKVSSHDGQLKITRADIESDFVDIPRELKAKDVKSASSILEFTDGWLVAADNGEWGGGLKWYSHSNPQTLHDRNTKSLLKAGKYVVAGGGLAHLVLDDGFLLRLKRNSKGNWVKENYYQMGTSIEFVFPAPDGDVYALGLQRLYRFDWKHGIVAVGEPYGFHSSYPNSAVQSAENEIYIGMRHAVAVFREDAGLFKQNWLVQKRCPYLKQVGNTSCECVGDIPTTAPIH